MLSRFESMTLISNMENLAKAVNENNDVNIMNFAHSLKSAAGYAGASHIHYACYFIQEHHNHGRIKQMLEYYPTLLEAAVTYRVYSRKVLAEYNKTEYFLEPEHETIPIANNYKIVKEESSQNYYALYKDQTIQDRKLQKSNQIIKP